jgi:bifunctional enzyme CysN/CysC/sulfate adenylyltransferase subunit 1
VTVLLEHDIDVSRGDMIVGYENLPGLDNEVRAQVCWMHAKPLARGRKYLLKHTTQTVQAVVLDIEHRTNILSFEPEPAEELALNEIGQLRIKTARPLAYDGYATNRLTGSFVLIEPGTNATVAAGMLAPPTRAITPEYTDFAI